MEINLSDCYIEDKDIYYYMPSEFLKWFLSNKQKGIYEDVTVTGKEVKTFTYSGWNAVDYFYENNNFTLHLRFSTQKIADDNIINLYGSFKNYQDYKFKAYIDENNR